LYNLYVRWAEAIAAVAVSRQIRYFLELGHLSSLADMNFVAKLRPEATTVSALFSVQKL